MPSDSQLMQIAINDVTNSSLPVEIRQRALEELLVLVEPIDNANGMHNLVLQYFYCGVVGFVY